MQVQDFAMNDSEFISVVPRAGLVLLLLSAHHSMLLDRKSKLIPCRKGGLEEGGRVFFKS
jgi:hypothetical protein